MAALIFNTLIEPFPVVFYDLTDHFVRDGSNFKGYYLLQGFYSLEMVLVDFVFGVAPQEKSQGLKSGERGHHPMSPRKETICPGNISCKMCVRHLVEITHYFIHTL